MARSRANTALDLSVPHDLTAGRIEALACPAGKQQAFLRDTKSPGLKVRVTEAGAKSYVFERKLEGQTLRRTIGPVAAWTIDDARAEANKLRVMTDQRTDPREVDRQQDERKRREAADELARVAADRAKAITVSDAWPQYLAEGKPRGKDAWKPRYRADLEKAVSPGGVAMKRGQGATKPGLLAALMPLRLADIDGDVIRDWYMAGCERGPVQAARAVAMFSGFLRWCSTRREYRDLVNRDAARSDGLADVLPAKKRRTDALEIDQVAPWFAGTDRLGSRAARAYLQALVLTGARREEMAALRWSDVDFRWYKLTVADKVGDTRVIPLTPYLAHLIDCLPRAVDKDGNAVPYVFASSLSKSGRIVEPRAPHADVLEDAGIPHVSIHGLRRTFALLGEAAGAPAGAIAQVMGHRPSAVAEGYKPRSIDALRPYLAQVESFILAKAGVVFTPDVALPGRLRVVSAT